MGLFLKRERKASCWGEEHPLPTVGSVGPGPAQQAQRRGRGRGPGRPQGPCPFLPAWHSPGQAASPTSDARRERPSTQNLRVLPGTSAFHPDATERNGHSLARNTAETKHEAPVRAPAAGKPRQAEPALPDLCSRQVCSAGLEEAMFPSPRLRKRWFPLGSPQSRKGSPAPTPLETSWNEGVPTRCPSPHPTTGLCYMSTRRTQTMPPTSWGMSLGHLRPPSPPQTEP